MSALRAEGRSILDGLFERRPDLADCEPDLLRFHQGITAAFAKGHVLYCCGNGGSQADAMHIAGELCKSFERKRPLPEALSERLAVLPFGQELTQHLEAGLPVVSLGLNAALKTASENDSHQYGIAFAQELVALARPGDVLLAISTSGASTNCRMAVSAAKALGMTTLALTGPAGGKLAEEADLALRAPGAATAIVQEAHLALYHALCAMVEAHFFPEPR